MTRGTPLGGDPLRVSTRKSYRRSATGDRRHRLAGSRAGPSGSNSRSNSEGIGAPPGQDRIQGYVVFQQSVFLDFEQKRGVRVTEAEGWVLAGWSGGDQLKTAVRTLSAAAQWSVTGVIWLAIFSPAWILVAIAAVVLWRRRRDRTDPAGDGGNDEAIQT